MERFSTIFLIAGLAFFLFAFVIMGVIPWLHFRDLPTNTVEEVAVTAMPWFRDLAVREPEAFEKAFPGGATEENCAEALQVGRQVYMGEGCWHCHSQFVRPVSNEELRWGTISYPAEYHNEMHLPPLLGTRRVGPDLTRQSGTHSNDWHIAHFYNPRLVTPVSVMPPYPWLFDEVPATATEGEGEGEGGAVSRSRFVPNKEGLSLITYVQWLGTWLPAPGGVQ